jgi:CBS domain-containing protein
MRVVPENLRIAAEQIYQTGESRRETVRSILSWFGAQRRGLWVVASIREALREARLVTEPDFELVFIDSEVKLSPIGSDTSNLNPEQIVSTQTASDLLNGSDQVVRGGSAKDPVPRIGMLIAANQPPTSVNRDTEVCEAVTLMLLNDFSQLPVLQNERSVSGMISWKSIGRARGLGGGCQYVRDCMELDVEILTFDAPLFEALQTIVDHEAVLVKGLDGRITGLVTTSDITLQFKSLSESFLLVGEIENHVRRIIDGKFTLGQLKDAVDPGDEERRNGVQFVSDLTFGEYIRLLENPDNWSRLGVHLDRKVFIHRLSKIREIRNDVMHFHPDGISQTDLSILRDTVRFMQLL